MSDQRLDPIQRIINAVCDVIAEGGVTNLSMRNVAAEAGATIGLITHHFPNRAAMLEAAVRETWKKEQEVVEWPAVPDKTAVLKSIEVFLPLDDERRRQLSVWVAFWALTQTSPELQEIHKDVHRHIRDRHSRWLQKLGFSRGQAQRVADRLALFSDGLLLYALLDPEYWTPARQRATVRDMIDEIFASAGRQAEAPS